MDNKTFDFLDATSAPVITFDITWYDTVAPRIKDAITIARLAALAKNEQTATIPEVVAYLATRAANSPMDSDWTEIFLWASCTTLKNFYNEDNFKTVDAKTELSRNQQDLLTQLRRNIYDTRRKSLKTKLNGK